MGRDGEDTMKKLFYPFNCVYISVQSLWMYSHVTCLDHNQGKVSTPPSSGCLFMLPCTFWQLRYSTKTQLISKRIVKELKWFFFTVGL